MTIPNDSYPASNLNLLKRFFFNLFNTSKEESVKLILGGILLALIISSYTLTKELQNTVFSLIVGAKFIPLAKLITVLLLIPAIFLDAIIVDYLKRPQILILYLFLFTIFSFTFCFILPFERLGDGQINFTDHDRTLAYSFYFFTECYTPFLVGLFWSLMNFTTTSKEAKNTYGFIVSISKIGGMIISIIAYLLISNSFNIPQLSDAQKIRIILIGSSSCLLIAALILLYVTTKTSNSFYKVITAANLKEKKSTKTGLFSGVKLLVKQPYVLGIFCLIFFVDCINEVINFQRVLLVTNKSTSINVDFASMLSSFYTHVFWMHCLGFILAFFVTNFSLRFLNMRYCLMLMPVIAISFIIAFTITGLPQIIIILYILMHAMNYSIAYPVRENLYVVTSKDIQTKAKFSIDVLGPKSSRAFSQSFVFLNNNYVISAYGKALSSSFTNIFLLLMSGLWLITCYQVSKKYQQAVDENKIIS